MKYLYELPKNASGYLTEKKIGLGFFELLKDKTYDQITIKDICRISNTSKPTFYRHFQDKYELLTKCIYFVMANFEKKIGSEKCYENPMESYGEIAELALDYIYKWKDRLLNITANDNDHLLFEPINNFLYLNASKKVKAIKEKNINITVSTEMLSGFFTGGIVSITRWILYSNKLSKEEVLENVNKFINYFTIQCNLL